jgi:hypothetical protein
VLLDSGPLVLLLCGTLRPDLVGTRKTKQHTLGQFLRLSSEIAEFRKHISLPNILTETSNHLGSGQQQAVERAASALSTYIIDLEEIYQPSKEVTLIGEYMSVGLADAAIISCVPRLRKERVIVYTQDFELCGRLLKHDVNCVNIMHWLTPSRS